jgi:hypothetical protein
MATVVRVYQGFDQSQNKNTQNHTHTKMGTVILRVDGKGERQLCIDGVEDILRLSGEGGPQLGLGGSPVQRTSGFGGHLGNVCVSHRGKFETGDTKWKWGEGYFVVGHGVCVSVC